MKTITLTATEFKTYSQAFLGSPKVPTNQSTKIFLGNTFNERNTINPLLPFEGDIIYEGRWGNYCYNFGWSKPLHVYRCR